MTNKFEDDFDLNQEDCTLQQDISKTSRDQETKEESNKKMLAAVIVDGELTCPKCGNGDFLYDETAVLLRVRTVEGLDEQGRLLVSADFDQHDDAPGENPHLFCEECREALELPEGIKINFV